jgi:tetratricopeptide (TPR) repeat protein
MALRMLEPSFVTGDAVALLRSSAEIERLALAAPQLAKYRELSLAQLALLREKPAEAERLLRAVLAPELGHPIAHRLLYSTYAEALNQLGRFEQAKEICLATLAAFSPEQRRYGSAARAILLALAEAEAALGQLDRATQLLNDALAHASARNNPLELGVLHAALARLALRRDDVAGFDLHRSQMTEHFEATGNPALKRQSEALLLHALSRASATLAPRASASTRRPPEELDGSTLVEARPLAGQGNT